MRNLTILFNKARVGKLQPVGRIHLAADIFMASELRMVMFLNSYILHGYVSACATALLLLPALQRLKCLLSSALRELLPTPDLRPFEPHCPNSALKCVAKIETDLWPNPVQQKRQGCLVTRQALLSRSVSLGGAAPASLSLSLSYTYTHTHTHIPCWKWENTVALGWIFLLHKVPIWYTKS